MTDNPQQSQIIIFWYHTSYFRKYAKNRAYTKIQIPWQKKYSADLWNYSVSVDEQVSGDIGLIDIWKFRMNQNSGVILRSSD